MKNILFAVSVLTLVGCNDKALDTQPVIHKIDPNAIEAPSIIVTPVVEDEQADIAAAHNNDSKYRFEYAEYDAEAVNCETDEYDVCLDGDLQDRRAAYFSAKHAADNERGLSPEGDAIEVIEDWELEGDEVAEAVEVVEQPRAQTVDQSELPPMSVWGRDLSNHMTAYPQETRDKVRDRRLIITGQVNQIFADGVSLGGTFVGIPTDGITQSSSITVYCSGAYPTSSWGVNVVGKNCYR